MKKRCISFLIIAALISMFLPVFALSAHASVIASGTSTEGFRWTFDSDGTLTISGTGKMRDFFPAGGSGGAMSWIAENCAQYYNKIEKIVVSSGITSIGNAAFVSCEKLTCVEISDTVQSIGDYAFLGCDALESVTIPDSVTTIGLIAFQNCESLIDITIPQSVKSIADGAFAKCTKLRTVTFTGNAPEFGAGTYMKVFEKVNATVYYPEGNATWTNSVKQNYGGSLKWVSYSVVTEIASGWSGDTQWILTDDGVLRFYGQGKLRNYGYFENRPWQQYEQQITAVVVESGITAIGECAFKGMTKLHSVSLPTSGLKTIGEAAFYGCSSLKKIDIPNTVYTVHNYTFKNCTALANIRLSTELVKVGQGAFENCTSLTYVYIPGNVDIIGAWSFKGCTDLEEADMIWTDATEIREGAFKNCTSLEYVHLPANIQTLGDSCFYGIGATSFAIPYTVKSIGAWCFARAYSLDYLYFDCDAPTIGEGAFNKITLTALYPAGNSSWTPALMQNYGGTVTWIPF